ncbi:hypothetical protein CR513_36810, partial [Mucuna pruriens]
MDPQFDQEDTRPCSDEDLKETKIGASLDPQIEGALVRVLCENWNTFTWSPMNMLGIDLDFLYRLSISPGYPSWLSNVVMVRKPSGKWRMCTDYTDLNKACPKDPYPLPSIDALVDEASRCGLLSFMDAYSGYNQIWMHPCDKSKTTFMTNEGNFCYKVMPFGLKNAGATY